MKLILECRTIFMILITAESGIEGFRVLYNHLQYFFKNVIRVNQKKKPYLLHPELVNEILNSISVFLLTITCGVLRSFRILCLQNFDRAQSQSCSLTGLQSLKFIICLPLSVYRGVLTEVNWDEFRRGVEGLGVRISLYIG